MQTFTFRDGKKCDRTEVVVDDQGFVYKRLRDGCLVCLNDECAAHFVYTTSGEVTNFHLTHGHTPQLNIRSRGYNQCCNRKCSFCHLPGQMRQGSDIKFDKIPGRVWKQQGWATCYSAMVVYSVECRCGAVYVGQTARPAFIRLGTHKYICSAKQRGEALGDHSLVCSEAQVDELRFQIVQVLEPGEDLLAAEEKWIKRVARLLPTNLVLNDYETFPLSNSEESEEEEAESERVTEEDVATVLAKLSATDAAKVTKFIVDQAEKFRERDRAQKKTIKSQRKQIVSLEKALGSGPN